MKNITHKIRVTHIPQVPMQGFSVEVKNEREAYLLENTLANQHLFLLENNVIPDYSNAIFIEMFEDGYWCDYYNEDEGMEWDEFVETYKDKLV